MNTTGPLSARPPFKTLAWIGCFAVAYFLAIKLGLLFRTEPEKFAIVWPPNGLLLGLLIVCDRRDRPLLMLTAALIGVIGNLLNGDSMAVSLGFTLVNVGEPSLAAWIWHRHGIGSRPFDNANRVFLLFVGAFALCSLTAVPGAAVVVLGLGAPNYASAWIAFLLSDAMALLLVTPLIVTWADVDWNGLKPTSARRALEVTGTLAGLTALTLFIFLWHPDKTALFSSYAWPLFPIILWVAIRLDLRVTTLALFSVSVVAIWSTGHGRGPFVDSVIPTVHRLLAVQLFLSVLSLSSFVLAAAFAESNRSREAAVASHRMLHLILNNIPQGVFWKDRESRCLGCNEVVLRTFGIENSESILGKTDREFGSVTPEQAEAFLRKDREIMDSGKAEIGIIEEAKIADGSTRWLETNKVPMRDATGQVIGLLGTWLDITQRKEAEVAQARTVRELSEFIENATVGIHWVGPDGIIHLVNRTELELLGYTREEYLGHHIAEFHVDQPVIQDILNRLSGDEAVRDYPARLRCKDGSIRHVLIDSRVLWEEGKFIHTRCFTRDITQSKLAEAALRESEQRWRFAIEGAGDGLWDWDIVASTVFFSTQWKGMLGFSEDDISNALVEWSKRIHPDDFAQVMADVEEHFKGSTSLYINEHRVSCKDGSWKWILARGMVVTRDALGNPLRMIGTHSDITERRLGEETIRSSLLEKEALLQEVHHRVKNNLQVINSLLRLESGRSTVPNTKAVLTEMQGRIRSMALLHESLYRSGSFAAVDLGAYLRQIATQSFRALAVSPGAVQLRLDIASVHVVMEQAAPCGLLVNELISNCLKHGFPDGRTGEVRIELRSVDGGPQIRLRVSDTGVGLPADFESKRSHTLGLELVVDLVEQLNGTLEIGPVPTVVFTVTFTPALPKPIPNH